MKEKEDKEKLIDSKNLTKSQVKSDDARFGLPEEMQGCSNLNMSDKGLLDIGNFLQKLHLRNHSVASMETIHEVYRSEDIIHENDSEFLSEEDELIFEDLQLAVSEHDIINLRTNLQFIEKNISAHNYTSEEIEDFLEGEHDEILYSKIECDALSNLTLAEDLRLYKEINEAAAERDIQELRASMEKIFKTESLHSRSIGEIDDYLMNEMEESLVVEFENEIQNNPGLMIDVKLSREINEAIGEEDVMTLRTNLINIKESEIKIDSSQKRGFSTLPFKKTILYAAASVVLLLGLNITFQNKSYTNSELYNEFYRPLEGNTGTTRSSSIHGEAVLNQALVKMNNKEYSTAFGMFSDILKNDPQNIVGNFYLATIHQREGRYDEAIRSFTNVIVQGDNLFVEQSEWYIGLCYINQNEREKAIRQLRKISQSKGFYQQQAKALLKKLE